MSALLPSRPSPTPLSGGGNEWPAKRDCVLDELLADGSMVLFNTASKQIMTLNPTAALVWECCDGAHSLAMIADEVREVFPDAPRVEADIRALVQELLAKEMAVDAVR